jgi:peptidoglycan hydrolase-like protein with peptidoglycan-binding domain
MCIDRYGPRVAAGIGCAGAVMLACVAAWAGPAPAATTPASPPSAPGVVPSAPAPKASGRMRLALEHVGGKPLFALVGHRIEVRGSVTPFVGGQRVKLSFYRGGRKVLVKTAAVHGVGDGTGRFRVFYTSRSTGLVQARAAHYATPQQALFSARSRKVWFVTGNATPGSRGRSVRLLQSELSALHYAVPRSGVFDEGTGRALIAYRKMGGLARVPEAGRVVFSRLQHGGGRFHVRYRDDGRHVEADLTRQVLVEVQAHGRVRAIYTMSSGKPSTPTVIGRFHVYLRSFGVNSEGMVDSSYFISGYAIHGYAEVPTYAASHGCLRVPIPDAAAIYSWITPGMPVDVYNESGGGSHRVRANAGP